LSQLRLGPNKPRFWGLLVPFLDALKLFKKEIIVPAYASIWYYYLSPLSIFLLIFFQFRVVPFLYTWLSFKNSGLFFTCLVGLLVYTLFFSGIASKSKYAILGSIRGIRQRISFEICLFFFVLVLFFFTSNFSLEIKNYFLLFYLFPVSLFFVLAELGRAPFDFIEGERELVRGYNVEYGGVLFVYLFLREYGFILFFRFLWGSIFFNWSSCFFFVPWVFFTWVIYCRRTLPRYRYDLLIGFFWLVLLPLIIHLLFLFWSLTNFIL